MCFESSKRSGPTNQPEYTDLAAAESAPYLKKLRKDGRLAQLVRALVSHTRGHWFESSIAHHGNKPFNGCINVLERLFL